MDADKLMQAASASMDAKGDEHFFKMMAPALFSFSAEERLQFRTELNVLVQKYAYPGKSVSQEMPKQKADEGNHKYK